MKKPRKVGIYKSKGMKLRTSGIIFDDEFNTDHIKTSPAKNRIPMPLPIQETITRQLGKDAVTTAYLKFQN